MERRRQMLKRFSAVILIITLLLSTLTLPTVFASEEIDKWDGTTVASAFAGGSGTQDDPYLISTCAELALLRDIVNATDANYDSNYAATFGPRETGATVSGSNLTHKRLSGKYFKLTNDLDMDGKNMKMGIGNSTGNASTFTFAGIFDGNYHIIRNYYTSYAWDLRAMGLFGITENATIKNLGVEFAKVSVANANANFGYAVLIGKAYGTLNLSNCYVRNSTVEITQNLGADTDMGIGILTGSIGDVRSTSDEQQIDNCYAVDNEITYSGETASRQFKKASVFGNTRAYGINVNNCYASCLTFTNMTLSGPTIRTNGMFTPSISGTTACSSTGRNCYVEGEPSSLSVDYLKLDETFTAISASELKALPSGLNSQGAYETTYADLINNGYPVLAWESEKYAPTAILFETAKGIIDNFDFAMISSEEATAVTENLNLFTEMDGLACIWQTSRSSSISEDGTVKRDFVDRSATLTLSVQFPDGTFYPQKKEINVKVLGADSNPEELTMKFDKWDGSVATSFNGGDGTPGNPYQIATGAQLALLRNIVNATETTYNADYREQYGARPEGGEIHTFSNTHFILTADLDLANINFGNPIGTYIDSANTFYFDGSFDGDGHVIKNFLLTTAVRNSGLFGYINNSEIKNLGMENVSILLGEATTSGSYGMLVGMARSGNTISECFIKNGSISISNKMSGTVSTRLGAICASIGVSGNPTLSDKDTTIQNCYAIDTSFDYTFGNSVVFDCVSIIGYLGNHKSVVKNCYAANATFGEDMIFPSITKNLGMMFRPNLGSATSSIENCYVQVPDSEVGTYNFSMGTVQKISNEALCELPAGLNTGETFTKEYSQETNGGFPILVWEKYAYELIEYMIYNTFTFSKISNESAEAVSENLNLITDLGYGVSGKWTSDNLMVIENDGTVHRRSFEQKALLTLELFFRGDTAFPQKISYNVTVVRLDGYSDEEILREYLDVVMTESYFTDQPSQSITENLKTALPNEGPDGISLSWENSDEVHIASDGTVLRPSWDEDNAEVSIKLTATKGTATAEKLFSFTVLKHISPETALSNAMDSVTYDKMTVENPSSITKKLNLPMEFYDYVSVEWSSSREDVISIEGKVIRQMHNTAVTITATFTHELSGETASKEFSFNVLLSPEGKMTEDYNEIVFPNIGQTVSDFELPLIGSEYQSTINWTSSDVSTLSIMQYAGVVQGCVKRPSFEEGDKVVTLTAAMENEGQKKSFTFDFVVLRLPSDEVVVQSAYDFITYETISAEPSSEIRNNLSLIKSFETGVVCDWNISDEETVNEDGKIFPGLNEDKTVTLTVDIHKGVVSQTKSFSFVIKGLSEQELLEKAREYLTFDVLTDEGIEEVCNDFVLPQTGDFGTVISWSSGNSALLETVNEDGQMIAKVKRPEFEENGKMVSLTATISLGDLTVVKEFFITLKAQSAFDTAFLLDFENDALDNTPSDPPTGTWAKTNASISAITANDPTGAENKVLMLSNDGATADGLRYTHGFNDKALVKGVVYAEMRLFVPSETQETRIRLYNFSETVMGDITIQQNGQIVVTVFDEGYREIFLKSEENLYDFDKWNDILMICNTETGKMDLFLNGDCISDNGELTVNGDVYFDDGIPFKSAPMTASTYFPLRKIRLDTKMGTVYADDISFKQLMSRYSESLYKSMESIDLKFCEQNNIEALKENLKIPDAPTGYILRTYSSNEDVLTDGGKVREVIDSDGYAEFTIELEYLAEKVRKTYPVYVSATTYTDEERVGKDMATVYADIASRYDFSNIREDMSFNTSAKYGSEVSIVSDNTDAISNDGKITRTDKDQKATLKLTVKRNDAILEKTFVVTVKAKESPKNVSSGGGGSSGSVAFGKNVAQDIFNRPETPVSFKDVKSSHWAYEAIMSLAEDGVVSGGENNYFNPNSNIKREEFIKMLLLAFNIEIGDYKNDFKDVDRAAWYRLYVSTARYHKITVGDENGNFGVGSEITRQDMAVMICRVAGLSNSSSASNTFADDAQIAEYAKNAVYSLKAKGILNGKGENKFAPLDTATRAEAAMLLYRISKEK